MQSGQMKLNLQVFCLTDILQRTVERYQKLLGEDYQICLEQNCRVWVKADELEISRVIYNLINNACTILARISRLWCNTRSSVAKRCACVSAIMGRHSGGKSIQDLGSLLSC